MLSPITEQITPGTKVLDSKIGVRADQFRNPSFVLSLDGPPVKRTVVAYWLVPWSGRAVFNVRLTTMARVSRVVRRESLYFWRII